MSDEARGEWAESMSRVQAETDQVFAAVRDAPELAELNHALAVAIARVRIKHRELGIAEPNSWSGLTYMAAEVYELVEKGIVR